MIVCRILGGLGNQMFQYAMGRALALRLGTELFLDTSWYGDKRSEGDTPRLFGLDAFQIKARVLHREVGGIPASATPGMPFHFDFGVGSQAHQTPGATLTYVKQHTHPVDLDATAVAGSVYLDGYWQDERYFDEAASSIRSDFQLSTSLSARGTKLRELIKPSGANSQRVSIHVRRGDYVSNPAAAAHHGLIEPRWYADAIQLMLDRHSVVRFAVFSDDTEWCRDHLPLPTNTIFITPADRSDAEDMVLMSLCSHHIIANSSFSWWGAWLNPSPAKLVLAPRRWTLARPDRPAPVPKAWVLL